MAKIVEEVKAYVDEDKGGGEFKGYWYKEELDLQKYGEQMGKILKLKEDSIEYLVRPGPRDDMFFEDLEFLLQSIYQRCTALM